MLKFMLSGTALTALVMPALAADLPSRAFAPPVMKPAFSWTGAYIGAHIGGGFNAGRSTFGFSPLADIDSALALNDVYGSVLSAAGPYASLLPLPPAAGYTAVSSPLSAYLGLTAATAYATYGSGLTSPSFDSSYPVAPNALKSNAASLAAGVELGYNHQVGSMVFGVAADFNWLGDTSSKSWASTGAYRATGRDQGCYNPGSGSGSIVDCSYDLRGSALAGGSVGGGAQWLSTLRLKAGVAGESVHVYATGGLAVGRVNMNSNAYWNANHAWSCSEDPTAVLGTGGGSSGNGCPGGDSIIYGLNEQAAWSGSRSFTKVGFAVGGGVEYRVTDNWLLKAEGLYYRLGSTSMDVSGTGSVSGDPGTCDALSGVCGSGSTGTYRVTRTNDGVIGRIGLSYKFN